jgi:hypothetical protein
MANENGLKPGNISNHEISTLPYRAMIGKAQGKHPTPDTPPSSGLALTTWGHLTQAAMR